MSKVYKNQLTVRVWRNIKTLGGLPSSHFGHASLTMSGIFLRGTAEDPRRRLQVSFWPKDGAGIGMSGLRKQPGAFTDVSLDDKLNEMSKLTAIRLEVGYRQAHGIPYPARWDRFMNNHGKQPINTPRSTQERLGVTSEGSTTGDASDQGWPLWSQSPEVKIPLPGFLVSGHHWGLSITRISKWWEKFKSQAPHYQALSFQNCAGVVLMALREGGAEAFVELPKIHVYAEPVQVEHYAEMLRVEMERFETWTKELDSEIREALDAKLIPPQMLSGTTDGLWTIDRWKEVSALGPLKPRSSAVRDIDDALAQYHSLQWNSAYAEKYWALAQVFRRVVIHRQKRADSERSHAVLGLGLQLLAYLRTPGPYLG